MASEDNIGEIDTSLSRKLKDTVSLATDIISQQMFSNLF